MDNGRGDADGAPDAGELGFDPLGPEFAAVWRVFRAGLRLVHAVVALQIRDAPEEEAEALREVARAAAFAMYGPDGTPDAGTGAGRRIHDAEIARGRWLVDRVVRGVQQARDALPDVVRGDLAGAADQAVVLWCLHVAVGVGLDGLGDAQQGDVRPPLAGRDLVQKIEGRMWLSAKPTGRAAPGVAAVFHEVQAALRERFPTRSENGGGAHVRGRTTQSAPAAPDSPPVPGATADELARTHFAYEWRRARRLGHDADLHLLTLLSVLAPAPLRVSWLAAAWGPLPPPLRELGTSTALTALTLRRLLDRGLLLPLTGADAGTRGTGAATTAEAGASHGGTREDLVDAGNDGVHRIVMPPALHALPAALLTPAGHRRWTNIALRFLSVALREDTHDHESWPECREAEPHVLRLTGLAERYGEGRAEAANLLDRLSVHHRVRDADPGAALSAGTRAVRLYEAEGVPSPDRYATFLTNYALAVRRVHGAAAALEPMERAVRISAAKPDDEHACALNLYASVLESAGRHADAVEVYEQALSVARDCYATGGTEEEAGAVTMVLNDYAVHLLRHGPSSGRRARKALRMLEEAAGVTPPGAYGSEHIMYNHADALRRLGRPEEARTLLEHLVALCEEWPEPAPLLLAALVDLSEVYEDLGDPRHADVLRRAHELDDLLAAR